MSIISKRATVTCGAGGIILYDNYNRALSSRVNASIESQMKNRLTLNNSLSREYCAIYNFRKSGIMLRPFVEKSGNKGMNATNREYLGKGVPTRRHFSIWNNYNESVKRHPLTVKSVTSGVMSFTADLICQYLFPNGSSKQNPNESFFSRIYSNISAVDFDYWRSAKFTLVGALYTGPSLHFWYDALATSIKGSNIMANISRLLLDQMIFAPAFIASFFMIMSALDGKSMDDIKRKLKEDLYPTVKYNFSVWVPAQFINFNFVPPHLQVLFANIVGFFWNIYLSYAANIEPIEPLAAEEVESATESK